MLPTHTSLVKSPLKMTKNHNVAIGVGVFVGIGFSGFDITSRWSSKGPFNSPETDLCHVEYLSFERRTKFGEISVLATFSYHFIHKNSVLFSTVFYL